MAMQTWILLENKKGVDFDVSDIFMADEDLQGIVMSDYDDSFNFIVGTANKEIDWFNNPYITANVYEMTESWAPKLSKYIKLQVCEKEQLTAMMTEQATSYYPNALCFQDRGEIKASGNWFGRRFHNPYISIESCNNNTYTGTCKSEAEIDEFMKVNYFYFGGQETIVNKVIYRYSDNIDQSFNEPEVLEH